MDTIFLRADGGADIGMGHLMRCIAFAEACVESEITPVLITANDEALEEVRRPDRMDIVTPPEKASGEDDVSITLDLYEQRGPGPVITDLCHEEYEKDPARYLSYLQPLNRHVTPLVVIDDLLTIDFPADVVVNPGYGSDDWGYPDSDDTLRLLGTDYWIFRSEFIQKRREMDRVTPDRVEDIVVTLGGSDQHNALPTVCRAIDRLEQPESVHAISGVDETSDWQKSLQEQSDKSWQFSRVCNEMAEVLAGADLAITGGGLTKYETALLGVPSVVLSQADHQHELMQEFQDAGTCVYAGRAGELEEEKLVHPLRSLCSDPDCLAEMRCKGLELVDGKGRERLLDVLANQFSIEPAKAGGET